MPPTPSDAVFVWNEVLRDALLADDQKPVGQREQGGVTRASRAAAIVHAAMHDAINGVDRRITPYLIQDRALAGASIQAAAAGAAHVTLSGLYPSQRNQGAKFDQKFSNFLNPLPVSGRDAGARFGAAVGNAILMARQRDGRNQPDPPYLVKQTPLEWRPDPNAPVNDQIPPLTPTWGYIRPFTLDYGPQFRPNPYPSPNSGDYTASFNEVRDKGRADSSNTRTPDQSQIARFFSYDDALGTPIRLYNQHVCQIITDKPVTNAPINANPNIVLHLHARIFALVNIAMADAGIGAWDAKFAYNLWRPVEGIRRANEDSNPSTAPVPGWDPLGRPRGPIDPATNQNVPHTTPPFPAYPSGHSSIGTAAYGMMRKIYDRNNLSFELMSDEVAGVKRNYNTFQKAIDENGRSRIFLGVHWNFDDESIGGSNIGGRVLGQKVIDYIFPNFLRPLC